MVGKFVFEHAPAQIITAPAQLITAPAQPPATGVVVYTALLHRQSSQVSIHLSGFIVVS